MLIWSVVLNSQSVIIFRAQEIFRDALQTNEIRIQLKRPESSKSRSAYMPDIITSGSQSQTPSFMKSPPPPPPTRSPSTTLSAQTSASSLPGSQITPAASDYAPSSTPREDPTPKPPTSPTSPTSSLQHGNTRKSGRRIHIELQKGNKRGR